MCGMCTCSRPLTLRLRASVPPPSPPARPSQPPPSEPSSCKTRPPEKKSSSPFAVGDTYVCVSSSPHDPVVWAGWPPRNACLPEENTDSDVDPEMRFLRGAVFFKPENSAMLTNTHSVTVVALKTHPRLAHVPSHERQGWLPWAWVPRPPDTGTVTVPLPA